MVGKARPGRLVFSCPSKDTTKVTGVGVFKCSVLYSRLSGCLRFKLPKTCGLEAPNKVSLSTGKTPRLKLHPLCPIAAEVSSLHRDDANGREFDFLLDDSVIYPWHEADWCIFRNASFFSLLVIFVEINAEHIHCALR